MNDKESNRFEFLNGLRGWAAVIVLLHHSLFFFLGQANPIFHTRPYAFVTDGHWAIFVFFVLSGFVLSIKAVRDPSSVKLDIAVTSRYFRLVIPVLATSLIAYFLLRFGLMYNSKAALLTATPGVTNIWLASFYNFPPSFRQFLSFSLFKTFFDFREPVYNSNLWTMPYEFQGSMLIYLVLGAFKKTNPEKSFVMPVLLATFVLAFISPPLVCFLAGYLLAEAYHKWGKVVEASKYLNYAIGACFIAPVYISTYHRPPNDNYLVLWATVAVASVTFCPILQKVFGCALSRFMGQISFPLYLIHIIVLCSLSSFLLLYLTDEGIALSHASYLVAAISITVSFLLACLLLPVELYSVKASKRIATYILNIKTG